MAINARPPLPYYAGKQARAKGKKIASCPEVDPVKAAWWRAGHHDQDMELGNRWTLQH